MKNEKLYRIVFFHNNERDDKRKLFLHATEARAYVRGFNRLAFTGWSAQKEEIDVERIPVTRRKAKAVRKTK